MSLLFELRRKGNDTFVSDSLVEVQVDEINFPKILIRGCSFRLQGLFTKDFDFY